MPLKYKIHSLLSILSLGVIVASFVVLGNTKTTDSDTLLIIAVFLLCALVFYNSFRKVIRHTTRKRRQHRHFNRTYKSRAV